MRKAIVAVGATVVIATSAILVGTRHGGQEAVPPPPSVTHVHPSPARQLFVLQNRARIRRGIPRVQWSAYASELAVTHSRKMLNADSLFHSQRYPYAWWGENIGVGPSVGSLFKAFMASPDHRTNILNPRYAQSGVGFASSKGVLWVTVVFLRR